MSTTTTTPTSTATSSNGTFATPLSPSPVAAAFTMIPWEETTEFDHKLVLTPAQRQLLARAEDNVLGYTLADSQDAIVYSRLLLHMLDQLVGPSGPSPYVSKLPFQTILSDINAEHVWQQDVTGVLTHYAIHQLYEVVLFLKSNETNNSNTATSSSKQQSVPITLLTTFYKRKDSHDLTLDSDCRPLLRLLHLGGHGDPFAQRKF
jgi:hypothetical protein